MPTTTWIQETVDDRFWEGRDTGGPPPPPPVFPCAICGEEFESPDRRSWHASEAHPLARPTLYLGDRPASSEIVVRKPLAGNEISVGSCTWLRVVLDGRALDGVAPADLGKLVADLRSAHLSLELENHRAVDDADVRASYVLRVAVPDTEELAEVDRAFVANLAVEHPSTTHVDSFAAAVSGLESARMYWGALAEYVYGVLAKEGPGYGGGTLPFGAFPGKFNRALAELSDHVDRPVAAAVVGAARLNLNDLVTPIVVTRDRRLDGCAAALHGAATLLPWSEPVDRRDGVAVVSLCPIDTDTHFVLDAYESLVAHEAPDRRLDGFESRVEDGRLSGADRSKLRVLLATALLRADDRRRARRHLEALAHDEVFRDWATSELGGAA